MSTRLLSSQYGGYKAQYGVAMYGGRNAELAQLVLFRPERYKLRMYNRTTQAFVAELPDWSAINRNLQLNRAEVMSFSYPLDTPRLVAAIKATTNRVLLTDNKGQTIEKYNVRDFEENSDDNTITVNCYSLMGQWANDRGVNYSATNVTARANLTAIFATKQVNQDLWGGIYLDYGQSDSELLTLRQDLDYKDKSILQIVEDFRERHGGIIYVDPDAERLVWRTNVRQSSFVKEIRFNKNMGTLRLKESPDSVRNRIIVKGKDAHNREISVTVNDAASQAEYGIRVKNVPSGGAGRFATIAELTDFGNELLIKLKDPAQKIDINSIDLSQADTSVDFSFDDIGLGQLVRLLHPDFSIATSDHMVIGIKQELSKSANIILQLGRPGELNESRTSDFIEMVAETFRRTEAIKQDERDQYPAILGVSDVDNIDDLLESTDHPANDWADGEAVITGATAPYQAYVRKESAPGVKLLDWVNIHSEISNPTGGVTPPIYIATSVGALPETRTNPLSVLLLDSLDKEDNQVLLTLGDELRFPANGPYRIVVSAPEGTSGGGASEVIVISNRVTDELSGILNIQTGTITGATNESPIVITDEDHPLVTGDKCYIHSVGGNTAANGQQTITRLTHDTFSLDGTTGDGAYTSGGTWLRRGEDAGRLNATDWFAEDLVWMTGLEEESLGRVNGVSYRRNAQNQGWESLGAISAIVYTGSSLDDLPNTGIEDTAIGRAAGLTYVRNVANNAWIPLFSEASPSEWVPFTP